MWPLALVGHCRPLLRLWGWLWRWLYVLRLPLLWLLLRLHLLLRLRAFPGCYLALWLYLSLLLCAFLLLQSRLLRCRLAALNRLLLLRGLLYPFLRLRILLPGRRLFRSCCCVALRLCCFF